MDSKFWHPRYWLVWFGIGVLKLLTLLPWKVQIWLGSKLGLLMFYLLKNRRFIACVNLELAFPELKSEQHKLLIRKHFISLGISVFDTAFAWWGSNKRLKCLREIEGFEHLLAAQKQNKGIILLSTHTTSLELGPRLLAMHSPLHAVYRPHQNELFDLVVKNIRTKNYGKTISRNNIREMIRSLKNGDMVWYAQDQSPNNKNTVIAPFFNIPTATNSSTSKIANLGNALIVPFFTFREENGYRLIFLPTLEQFPNENHENDAEVINSLIEKQIRTHPDQYLWVHKRFKDLPNGENRYAVYNSVK